MEKRELRPELQAYILNEIMESGTDISTLDFTETVLAAAQALVGVREEGSNSGKIIELIQDTVGKAQREAWCMAAMQSCIAFAEVVKQMQSPIIASEHCMTTWRAHKKSNLVSTPTRGSLIIWNHLGSDRGHVGIISAQYSKDKVWTLEGNTGPQDSTVNREGDGFYVRKRSISGAGTMRVVGFLKVI